MQASDKKRPLSPHLQIYRLPLVSILSITHRITGVVLFLSFLIIWWIAALYMYSPAYLSSLIEFLSVFFYVPAFFFFLSLNYHLMNGLRHLAWDMQFFFSLQAVNVTNIVVMVATAVLTFLSMLMLPELLNFLLELK